MRVFDHLPTAIKEIQRDLFKSPIIHSTRVQQFSQERDAHESLNYAYTMLPETIPLRPADLVEVGINHFTYWAAHSEEIEDWLILQACDRSRRTQIDRLSDEIHPALADLKEGEHYAYTYRERLLGAAESLFLTLHRNEDSRRAFWPIYTPIDAVRGQAKTRIPCSLGYHLMIRRNGPQDYLHCTYLQRSADFDIFWLSDLFFAHRFQQQVLDLLKDEGHELSCGQITHIILSFHSFIRVDKEIY